MHSVQVFYELPPDVEIPETAAAALTSSEEDAQQD